MYSADPAYVKSASPYTSLSYESMLMLSQHGAKVLHAKAIEWAKKHHTPIHVLSTMKPDQSGTWIMDNAPNVCGIVYKPVLSWRMNCLPQEETFEEGSGEIRCGIPFVDWVVSAKGLHFLTWAEDYHQVRSQWPDALCSDPKMLIPAVLGAFVGTYLSIKFGHKKNEISP